MSIREPRTARDQFVDVIELRTRIFGGEPTFEQAVAFICGYEMASGYSLLTGFDDWLLVKMNDRNMGLNYHWSGLARELLRATPSADQGEEGSQSEGERLLRLLVEFIDAIDTVDGRRSLYREYEELFFPRRR